MNKYTPAVLAGIRNGAQKGGVLFKWPAAVKSFGTRSLGTLTTCADCPKGIHPSVSSTWVLYGKTPLCLACSRRRTKP